MKSGNININIKTVLAMFGESERCIMHKNTAPIEVKEIFFTNDDLDKLIQKQADSKL
jgi:hypothetical protein